MTIIALNKLMSEFMFQRLCSNYPNYPIREYLADLSRRIWSYPENGHALTELEMELQMHYIFNLIKLVESAYSTLSINKPEVHTRMFSEKDLLEVINNSGDTPLEFTVGISALKELRNAEKAVEQRKHLMIEAHYESLVREISGYLTTNLINRNNYVPQKNGLVFE